MDAGAGPAGGVLVPIVLGGGWSLAPEVRVSVGAFGEHGGYLTFYSGVRAMWGFLRLPLDLHTVYKMHPYCLLRMPVSALAAAIDESTTG